MYEKRKGIDPVIATLILFALTFTVAFGGTARAGNEHGKSRSKIHCGGSLERAWNG